MQQGANDQDVNLQELADILICPVCHSDLEIGGAHELLCRGCMERYPVKNGIPIMLPRAAGIVDREFVELYERLGQRERALRKSASDWEQERDFFHENIPRHGKIVLDMGGRRGYS